jgi:hypothetical protein
MSMAHKAGRPLYQIFIDFSKAYPSMDRGRTLEILEGYGVGLRTLRIFRNYWGNERFVARQGGFYGEPFHIDRGCTQGDPVAPTIFNIVEDAVLRYWYERLELDQLLTSALDATALFYADDGQVAGFHLPHFSAAFKILCELFSRVGLELNATKTVSMVCGPKHLGTHISSPAQKRRVSGEGESYRERQRRKVQCPHCPASFQERRLSAHLLEQHGRQSFTPEQPARLTAAPRTYRMSFPSGVPDPVPCPVPLCEQEFMQRGQMRVHFAFRHPTQTLLLAEDSGLQLCAVCNMRVKKADATHRASKRCRQLAALSLRRAQLDSLVAARKHRFQAPGGAELGAVDSFCYLGRVVTSTDDDEPALQRQLKKAASRWGCVRRVLTRQGATPRIAGLFYKAACQAVLLYGSETWCFSPRMIRLLESFHHRVARCLTGRHIRARPVVPGSEQLVWVYPDSATVLEAAGLLPMRTYLSRRRERLRIYAETESTWYQRATDVVSGTTQSKMFWWDQHDYLTLTEEQ